MKRKIEIGNIYTCADEYCCYLEVLRVDKMNVDEEAYICRDLAGKELNVTAINLNDLVYHNIRSKKNKFKIEMNKILGDDVG